MIFLGGMERDQPKKKGRPTHLRCEGRLVARESPKSEPTANDEGPSDRRVSPVARDTPKNTRILQGTGDPRVEDRRYAVLIERRGPVSTELPEGAIADELAANIVTSRQGECWVGMSRLVCGCTGSREQNGRNGGECQ